MRKPGASDIILKLVETADVLIEGNRPGVTERLGIGPQECHAINPKLVYGRMTGWGQSGPWAKMAGHDINYISVTGALHAMGPANIPPPPPLNLIGDFGGGSLFLVNGVLAALLKAEKTGQGDVIDAAIVDGVNSLMTFVHNMDATGLWSPKRGQTNLLDGSAPFYRCYETEDGGFMAVGCIEPQFFAEMIRLMNIEAKAIGNHFDVSKWPQQHNLLETHFRSKTRQAWPDIFDGTDACVTPVLDYKEAVEHAHIHARNGLLEKDGAIHPMAAPLFLSEQSNPIADIPAKGTDTKDVLKSAGFSEADIEAFVLNGVVNNCE